ncbi:unnamed protein product [Symbiodinium sp. CCMP2592]|nr:unnamed protein product [Symbiodinium sp. CCMP2592]
MAFVRISSTSMGLPTKSSPSSRGSQLRSDWTTTFSLSVVSWSFACSDIQIAPAFFEACSKLATSSLEQG